ncbi:MAG: hypothetical protein RLZZ599_387, partial [Bacteroidota bacterium]
SGVISSVHLIKKEERIYPYLIGAFSTLTTANYLQHQHLPEELVLSVFLSAFIIIVSIILLPFLKSSAHMAGISGLFALYLILHQRYDFGNTPGLFVVAMLLCSVAWARLSLNRHTLLELLIGFTVGFFPLFLLLSR